MKSLERITDISDLQPLLEEVRRANAKDALTLLVERFGEQWVHSALENIAAVRGQDLPCRRAE
jgi:hypothetical protein